MNNTQRITRALQGLVCSPDVCTCASLLPHSLLMSAAKASTHSEAVSALGMGVPTSSAMKPSNLRQESCVTADRGRKGTRGQ